MPIPIETTTQPSARERLLRAADELFYAEGIHTVGIDRVIERAGVAKATLYSSFGNKEGLIAAYLEGRHARIAARIERHLAPAVTPRDRLLAIFDAEAELVAEPTFHGCAFVGATAEALPGSAAALGAEHYRGWLRSLLIRLAAEAGAADPPSLARQLQLLWDGAALAARLDFDKDAATAAQVAAAQLLDDATRAPMPRRARTTAKR